MEKYKGHVPPSSCWSWGVDVVEGVSSVVVRYSTARTKVSFDTGSVSY